MKQITSGDWATSRRLALNLSESWLVVPPSDPLRTEASHLVDRYDLKAADAMQLAAALEWCEHVPKDRVFLTADHKLREAALLSGFDAKPL